MPASSRRPSTCSPTWARGRRRSRPASRSTRSGPPAVATTTPASGATAVALESDVRATFDRELDPGTIDAGDLYLTEPGGAVVPASLSLDNPSKSLVLHPDDVLEANVVYTAHLGTGIKSWHGDSPAAAATWSFTTGPGSPPVVTTRTPAAAAAGVFTDAAVTARFNRRLNPATVTASTFTVRPAAGGSPVAATVSYDAATRTARAAADRAPEPVDRVHGRADHRHPGERRPRARRAGELELHDRDERAVSERLPGRLRDRAVDADERPRGVLARRRRGDGDGRRRAADDGRRPEHHRQPGVRPGHEHRDAGPELRARRRRHLHGDGRPRRARRRRRADRTSRRGRSRPRTTPPPPPGRRVAVPGRRRHRGRQRRRGEDRVRPLARPDDGDRPDGHADAGRRRARRGDRDATTTPPTG